MATSNSELIECVLSALEKSSFDGFLPNSTKLSAFDGIPQRFACDYWVDFSRKVSNSVFRVGVIASTRIRTAVLRWMPHEFNGISGPRGCGRMIWPLLAERCLF